MTPREYEEYVYNHYKELGYDVKLTPQSNDYGVDILAKKDDEKLAIQTKMYGHSTRKVNRQMIMELCGAKEYYDCTKAVLATDGEVMSDAVEVAHKLNIEILNLQIEDSNVSDTSKDDVMLSDISKSKYGFDYIWEKYIFPLKGKTLRNSRGDNTIVDVDWSRVTRITSNGKRGYINIEDFKMAVNILLEEGCVTRDDINQRTKRVSSGIVLILSQVPFFELKENPLRLEFVKGASKDSSE